MIVTDDKLSAALDYLNADPHPLAAARARLFNAENDCKECWSRAFLAAEGSVEARKAAAELNQTHLAAKERHAAALEELENQKRLCIGAEMLIEAWRTEQSNIRHAERVR